ncbi:MAG: type III toxin-antitoxin system ToxN/AbiQ family toxin [Oscillospiraceae bacterium]|jgi:protein AbiQ|nr:type III toxin-antitoxin system ToxN/AbiQ family toxin [Oscillospiraceae bacterium]
MELYTINTDYIDYLKKYQAHIWDNEDNGRLRPYAGIVLTVGGNNYYVPLSSPKTKHQNMGDRLDFIRLEHRKQLKGVLNLNNMLPVNESLVKKIEIGSIADNFYKNLLNLEMIDIRRKQATILRNANIIYNKTTKYRNEPQNQRLVSLCYDFLLLEQKLKEYVAGYSVQE